MGIGIPCYIEHEAGIADTKLWCHIPDMTSWVAILVWDHECLPAYCQVPYERPEVHIDNDHGVRVVIEVDTLNTQTLLDLIGPRRRVRTISNDFFRLPWITGWGLIQTHS
jgi:hypothetical protein